MATKSVTYSLASFYISGPAYLYLPGDEKEYNLFPLNSGASISWSVSPNDGWAGWYNPYSPNLDYVKVKFMSGANTYGPPEDSYLLTVNITLYSGCTAQATKWIDFRTSKGGSAAVYPNPVSDILYIDLDQIALEPTLTDSKQLKDPLYDVRLYDDQGNLLRQTTAKGGIVEFNVATLPNGIYYLHIFNGIDPKPDVSQIVVEH